MEDAAATRQEAGAKGNRMGKLIEKGLDGMHTVYRMQRRAIIARLNVPTRLTPKKHPSGKIEWVLIQCGQAEIDFAGTLPKGEAIFVEAKASSKKAASLNVAKGGTHERGQLIELAARHRLGAHAVLLWWNGDRLGILTGEQIDAAERSDAKNIPAERFIWMEPGEWDWLTCWSANLPIHIPF